MPTGLSHAYSSNDATGGSSFSSMNGMMYNSTGHPYHPFVQEVYPSSSSSGPEMHSSGIDPRRFGEGFSAMTNTQAMDSGMIAMWSNAPSGFEYVVSLVWIFVGYLFIFIVQYR